MTKLSKEINELMQRESTIDFLAAARQFISLIEGRSLSQELFYKEAHESLAKLYQTGLKLKKIELVYSGPDSEFEGINKDELRKQNENLISKLGKDCFYWKVFDPTVLQSDGKPTSDKNVAGKEVCQGWVVDDLADIYADLKEEITKIDSIKTDEAIEDGLWQLKFGFNNHWGNHCVDAIRALHYIWYDGRITRSPALLSL